jgi:hypothetical protein
MTKISQMLPAQSLTGSELVEVVQGGINKRTTAQAFFANGKSAYQVAVDNGFVGTPAEWLTSLAEVSAAQLLALNTIVSDNKKILDQTVYFMRDSGVKVYSFAPSLVWRVKHNAMTVNFVESLKNTNHERVYANVKIIDATEFWVEFTEPEAGTVSVVFQVGG